MMWGPCQLWLLLVAVVIFASSFSNGLDFHDFNHVPETVQVDYGSRHPMDRRHRRMAQEDDDNIRQDITYPRSQTYEQIRIHFVTDLLEERRGENDETDAQIDYIMQQALPAAAQLWSQHLSVIPNRGSIQITEGMCFGAFGTGLAQLTVENADLVVIIGGQDFLSQPDGSSTAVCEDFALAVGSSCVLDQWDRPIVGFVNFCLGPQMSVVGDTDAFLQTAFAAVSGTELRATHVQTDMGDVAVHELGHILAFAAYLYKFFRHADGTPRTPRPFLEQPVTCVDGSQIIAKAPSNNTVQLVEALDGRLSYSMVTPRVRQVARNQLNCQEAVGARLEDQQGCVGSHWHERLFFGEVMSPALSVSSENVLSPLTLALMEDSGWYEVDYTGASIPSFGLGAGCDFVTGECIVDDQVPEWGKGYFCDSPIRFVDGEIQVNSRTDNNIVCDPSHRAWTLCDLWDEATVPRDLIAIPESSKRYFSDNDLVPSFTLAEYCPIPSKSLGLDCTKDDEYTPSFVGESVGANSRCINAVKSNGQPIRRPACMKVTCDTVEGRVIIGDGENEQVCSFDGEILPVPSSTTEFLECPRLATICPELFSCVDSCAGRGVCVYDGTVPVCIDAAGLPIDTAAELTIDASAAGSGSTATGTGTSATGAGSSTDVPEDTPENLDDTSATTPISLYGFWASTLLVLLTL
jgi:hypothetical protein